MNEVTLARVGLLRQGDKKYACSNTSRYHFSLIEVFIIDFDSMFIHNIIICLFQSVYQSLQLLNTLLIFREILHGSCARTLPRSCTLYSLTVLININMANT